MQAHEKWRAVMTRVVGSKARCVQLICLLLGSAGAISCGRTGEAPAQRRIDFADVIAQSNKAFIDNVQPASRNALYEYRSRLQDQLLEEFDACPQCFAKKYPGAQRTYLFDAITDCETTIRVGTPFDGGKWICDPQSLSDAPVVYSFGIGDNISFDLDMAGMFGCTVYMFDPSPSVVANFSRFQSGQPCGKGHISFLPLGLGPVSREENRQWDLVIEGKRCEVRSLAGIAKSLHHTRIDILKLDIEGSEMAALQQMLATGVLPYLQVRQLLVEFHLWDDASFVDFVRIMGALKKQGFLLFRKEFNPYAADKCAEFSFVRR
jgi:hypothetical protein